MKVSSVAASRSPSKLYLEEGSTIKVEDAIMALIIKSANDVATVVAENISNTEREFAKLMNIYAKNLGMKNTTFKNASGLPNRAQMTTARDMAILSHALIKNFPICAQSPALPVLAHFFAKFDGRTSPLFPLEKECALSLSFHKSLFGPDLVNHV